MGDRRLRLALWAVLLIILIFPIIAAAFSPYLQWRDPIYIVASFAGIVAMSLLVVQPLAASALLPWIHKPVSRRLHRALGAAITGFVVLHVVGLWLTSPPDVIDALLFVSPTPFSVWGVLAMWAIFASAIAAVLRFSGRMSWRRWRVIHVPLAVVIAGGTILHALLIDGTMEHFSKLLLCVCLALGVIKTLFQLMK